MDPRLWRAKSVRQAQLAARGFAGVTVIYIRPALTDFRAKERLHVHARNLGFENFLEKEKYIYLYI